MVPSPVLRCRRSSRAPPRPPSRPGSRLRQGPSQPCHSPGLRRAAAPAYTPRPVRYKGPDMAETASLPDIQAMSFEEALEELEGIVRQLEAGRFRLDDSISAYERGAA